MSTLRGKKYSGTLYGRMYGSTDAFQKMGNLSELTTSKENESNELPSTGRDDFGEAIEVENAPGVTEITLGFNSFDKDGLARALMGEAVDLGGTVETLTAVKFNFTKGGWIDLPHEDIDPANFAVKDGSTTVAATSYELNPRLGMIKFNDDVTITDNKELNYSGKTLGSVGFEIDANTLQSLPLELKLDGKDRITGKDGILIVPHAVLSSNGDINWLSDDWWENGLSGKLVKDDGKPTMRFKEFG